MNSNNSKLSSDIKFITLCNLFTKIQDEKRQNEKINILTSFITKNCPNNLFCFYPVLRLFLPKLDRERSAYGLKEKKIADIIINVLSLPKGSADYNALINYATVLGKNIKDFTDVACSILRKSFLISSNLSIKDVNKSLDKIAQNRHDIRQKEQEIIQLLRKTNSEEQKWIIRLLLKDMKLGISHEKILNLYHKDAAKLYFYKSNILKVCQVLHSREINLHEIGIEIFTPFYPMLSEKCDIKIINNVINENDLFTVEKKFDGERFQLHMKDGVFQYYSRKGYNFTDTFGGTYDEGLYTPNLKNIFKPIVKNIILDGEMMGYNKEKQQFGSKGMNFDVKNLTSNSSHQPCFIVFDIVLLNNDVLTNKSLHERLQILNSVIIPKTGVLMLSEVSTFKTKQELLDYLNKSIDDEEEGIVFKKPNSIYTPNTRNGGWYKLKLEYFENVMSDMDLIIMGGYYGVGSNAKTICGFLLGVADKYDQDSYPSSYLSFAKIQSGLNAEELEFIHNKVGQYWKTSGDPESYGLIWGKEKPHLWIPPENSLLLVVRGSELTKLNNNDYKTPYTIRFPRIQRINDTKPFYDCFSMYDLSKLTETSKSNIIVKLSGRHLTLNDLILSKKPTQIRKPIVPMTYDDIERVTEILENYEFCIWSGKNELTKSDVEKIIVRNGGKISPMERTTTLCALVGDKTLRLMSYEGLHDVVKLSWIFRIIDEGSFELYNKNEVIYATSSTKLRLMSEYDKYGDSYTKFATEKSLREIIDYMKVNNDVIIPSSMEIADLKQQIDRQLP